MNNKGFAITTLIYGLSILGILLITLTMSILSSSRKNIRELSDKIEEDLLNYGKSEVVYTGANGNAADNVREFVVPGNLGGYYRIEAWGAQGGNDCKGGYGAYTSGIIKLENKKKIYIYPGKCGTNTYVSLSQNNGAFDDTLLMLAEAGGGDFDDVGGTIHGYSKEMFTLGGNVDIYGNFGLKGSDIIGSTTNSNSSFKVPIIDFQWEQQDFETNGGSVISGYPGGYQTVGSRQLENGKFFLNSMMFPGVNKGVGKVKITRISDGIPQNNYIDNVSQLIVDTNYNNYSRNCSLLYLERIVEANGEGDYFYKKKKKNENERVFSTFTGFSRIGDISLICKKEANDNLETAFFKLKVVYSQGAGEMEIYNGPYNVSSPTGIKISPDDPLSTTNLPDRGNYYIMPVTTDNRVMTAPSTDQNLNPVYLDFLNGSNYQKWSIEKIDKKYCYDENEAGDDNCYKITDLASFRALELSNDENFERQTVATKAQFNTLSVNRGQAWIIKGNRDGTFSIHAAVKKKYDANSGYLFANTATMSNDFSYEKAKDFYNKAYLKDEEYNDKSIPTTGYGNIMVGGYNGSEPTITERFRLYSLDFSSFVE